MKSLRTFLLLIFIVLIGTTFIFSSDSKVRVTASKANIRLSPSPQSTIISTIPLGAVLEIINKKEDWYFVKLPADEKGIVVTGYIHESIVEVFEEPEEVIKPQEKEESPRITQKPIELTDPKEKTTGNADYLKWKEDYYKAETSFKKWKKYVYIGMFGSLGGALVTSVAMPLLFKENFLVPMIGGMAVSLGATGLWIYAANRRGSASEKMELLMNEGRIKKYIGAIVNPQAEQYGITFAFAW